MLHYVVSGMLPSACVLLLQSSAAADGVVFVVMVVKSCLVLIDTRGLLLTGFICLSCLMIQSSVSDDGMRLSLAAKQEELAASYVSQQSELLKHLLPDEVRWRLGGGSRTHRCMICLNAVPAYNKFATVSLTLSVKQFSVLLRFPTFFLQHCTFLSFAS